MIKIIDIKFVCLQTYANHSRFPGAIHTSRGWTSAEPIKRKKHRTWGIKWRSFWCAQPWRQQPPLRVSPHCDTSDYAGKSWRFSSSSLQCRAQVACLTLLLPGSRIHALELPPSSLLEDPLLFLPCSRTLWYQAPDFSYSFKIQYFWVPSSTAVLLCLSTTPYFLEFLCQPSESAGKYLESLITALQSLQPFVKKVEYWLKESSEHQRLIYSEISSG